MNTSSNSVKLSVLSEDRKSQLNESLVQLEKRVLQIANGKVQKEAETRLKIATLKRERSFAYETLAKTHTMIAEIDKVIADVKMESDIIQIEKKLSTPRAMRKEPQRKKPKRSEAETAQSEGDNSRFYQRQRVAKETPSSSTAQAPIVITEGYAPDAERRPSTTSELMWEEKRNRQETGQRKNATNRDSVAWDEDTIVL